MPDEYSSFHPDLARRARMLPRGLARRWSVPVLKQLGRLSRFSGGDSTEIQLDDISVFVSRPKNDVVPPHPALLWIHGGGLIMGDGRQDTPFCQALAEALGLLVVSVQYRLAPQYPFPTPLDDCVRAFEWLAGHDDIDPERVIVGGASAGGGLAAALCQRLAYRGQAQPSFQLLVYPMLDDRSAQGSGPNDHLFRLWDRKSNAIGWDGYLRGHDRVQPPMFAVPARHGDLGGLPPAWIGVGTLDLFLEEGLAYAEGLRGAGVTVEVEVVEGAYHGFDGVDSGAPVSQQFRDAQIAAITDHLAGAE